MWFKIIHLDKFAEEKNWPRTIKHKTPPEAQEILIHTQEAEWTCVEKYCCIAAPA